MGLPSRSDLTFSSFSHFHLEHHASGVCNHSSQFPEQTLGSSLSGFVRITWPTQKIQPCYPSTPLLPTFWPLASPLLEFSPVINIQGNLWQQLYSYHRSKLCVFCHGLILLDFLSQSMYTLWHSTALVSAFTKRLWGLTYSSLYAWYPAQLQTHWGFCVCE